MSNPEQNGEQSLSARFAAAVLEPDPEKRLRLLGEIHAETMDLSLSLRASKRAAIDELRDRGATWHEIGGLLGVSAQRAYQLSL